MALFQVKKKSKKKEEDSPNQKKRNKNNHKKSKKKPVKEISISSDSSQEVIKAKTKSKTKKRSKRPRNESSSVASSSILTSPLNTATAGNQQPQTLDTFTYTYPFWKLHLAQIKGTARTDPQEAEQLTHAMKHIQKVYDNKDKQRSILGRLFKAKLSYENSDFDKKQALDCFLMNNHIGAKDIVLKIVEKQRIYNETKNNGGSSTIASSPDKSKNSMDIDQSRHSSVGRSAYSTAYGNGKGVRPILGKQLSIFKKGISERTEFDHSVADQDSVASSMTEEDHVDHKKKNSNIHQTPKRSNQKMQMQQQQSSSPSSSFPYPLGVFDHIDLNAMEWLPIDTQTSTFKLSDEASNASSELTPNTVTSQQIDEIITTFQKQKSSRRHTIPYGSTRQLHIPKSKEQSSRTTETSDTSESPRDVMRRIEQKWKKDVDLLQVSRSTARTTETARQRMRRLERAYHVRSR